MVCILCGWIMKNNRKLINIQNSCRSHEWKCVYFPCEYRTFELAWFSELSSMHIGVICFKLTYSWVLKRKEKKIEWMCTNILVYSTTSSYYGQREQPFANWTVKWHYDVLYANETQSKKMIVPKNTASDGTRCSQSKDR